MVFDCDVPLLQLVGCLVVHGESLESMEDGYAQRTCDKVLDMLEKFATPLGEQPPDHHAIAKFLDAMQSIIVDGAFTEHGATTRQARLHQTCVALPRLGANGAHRSLGSSCANRSVQRPTRATLHTRHAPMKDIQYWETWQAESVVFTEKGASRRTRAQISPFQLCVAPAGVVRRTEEYACLL